MVSYLFFYLFVFISFFIGDFIMRPLKRMPVSKHRSAKSFRRHVSRTKSANLSSPMRGGWRL